MNVSRTGTEAQEISDRPWNPPVGTLGELVREMERRQMEVPEATPAHAPLFAASLRSEFVAVIAEIKRSSPSRGMIRRDLDAGAQAADFQRGGAAAISVLTEPSRFGGSLDDIARVREESTLPILKKDFHISARHIHHAKSLGASAALLIVRAVPPAVVRECVRAAAEVGIDLLVEIHRESELELAIEAGAQIIGVNTRDLETLEMHPETHAALIPKIPAGIIAVAESGMSTVEDVEAAAASGADAVLIGSSLSQARDASVLLRLLTRVKRRGDVRPN